ncbi:hypothetical protein [uncultured Jannaschia sp.]|uniref:hypothetical protein n=1 Tax=uncultured Jannaschia sp. TaxID=293347 RepID=UPI00261D5D26|nr:hypothetical protein [uncultured Jannaschia sp.]
MAETDPKTTPRPDAPATGTRPAGTTAPPAGSTHSAVETPTDRKSRNWLWIAVAAVVGLLLVVYLLSMGADPGVASG